MIRLSRIARNITQRLATIAALTAALFVTGCAERSPAVGAENAAASAVDFNTSVRPILNAHCIACHGGVKAASGLSFLFPEEALVVGESGRRAIVPGDADESYLLERITDRADPMPPADHGAMLDAQDVVVLEEWIRQGAHWGTHWAYEPPKPGDPPAATAWAKTPVDHFIAKGHADLGLEPNSPAEPHVFLRRLTLDLTGLPPTPADQATFTTAWNIDADQAVAAVTDRLLASTAYGERMATVWMDLARYADTMGYEKDAHRTMWPYRDGLIRSFNADKPYDRFLTEQLAGDLLPDRNAETVIATAFHRQTQTNAEGGTDDEEFRVAAVIDRVNTTWTAVMGSSFGCVQCHAHPYDPFHHEDYYRFKAFFNNTADTDDGDYPRLVVPEDLTKRDESVALQLELRALEASRDHSAMELSAETAWVDTTLQSATLDGEGSIEASPSGVLHVRGTVHARSTYVVNLLPNDPAITAIRLDALLPDGTDGLASVGFQLSQIEAAIVDAAGANGGESAQPIALQFAATDFSRGDQQIDGVLREGRNGWSLYPYQFRNHQLVVFPEAPVTVPDGASLRITLHHRRGTEKSDAHSKRFKLRTTSDPRWQQVSSNKDRIATDTRAATTRDRIQALAGVRVPVVFQRPASAQRASHVFVGGNWMTAGEPVRPGTPGSLPDLSASTDAPSRLDLARWITAEEHPLTARVIVNRLWAQVFGRGIVATLEDFGTQGAKPTNQPLLDWLAVRLVEDHGWRLKPMFRDLVTSATYRQSARASAKDHTRDPYNAWLARGPRTRLSAEMVRDQALAVSGLLSKKMFGPAVMPVQPAGVWQVVYSGATWKTSPGEDRHRRAVYTYWRRTSPYPSAMTFDAPSREFCVADRLTTNTPLHALVTLNDPVYAEAAEALATRSLTAHPDRVDAAILEMCQRVIGTTPSPSMQSELLALFESAGEQLASESAADDTIQTRAMTVVASVLLNLDLALTK